MSRLLLLIACMLLPGWSFAHYDSFQESGQEHVHEPTHSESLPVTTEQSLEPAVDSISENAALISTNNESTSPETVEPAKPEFSELVAELPGVKLRKLPALAEQLAASNDPKVSELFFHLLNASLYYVRDSKQVIYIEKNAEGQYQSWDFLSSEPLGLKDSSEIKKIRTNNRSRSLLRGLLAQLNLSHKTKAVRMAAIQQLLDKPNQAALEKVQSLLSREQDKDVLELMHTALAIELLKTGDHEQKLAAVARLQNSLEPAAKNALDFALKALPEEKSESELQLSKAISSALDNINAQIEKYEFVENLFFGLSLGSVLLLAAIGLSITFGVMGVINMAHGEMIMLGAYTTYVIQLLFPQWIEYSLLIAIPAAFLVSGSVGVVIERCVIRFLKGRPLETLLATFGISLILQQLVRSVFSPLNRQVTAPEWMSGSWQINPVFSLTYNRLYIIIFSLIVFFSLMLLLKKSSLGLHVRAVAQNRDMARALSIKSGWVDAITFGLGSGIAGIAGVVLSQLTNVGPNLGQAYIIDSFLVVVFGGVGNLWGTLVAAMSLGSINKFLEPMMGSVLANIIVLLGLVLFIQKRPKGLFPQKGRAE